MTSAPYAPHIVDAHELPPELVRMRSWICWRLVQKPGKAKPDKLPISPITGNGKDWLNPAHHADFETARDYAEAHKLHGLGIVLAPGCGLAGGDLDHCIDPATGEVSEAARGILAEADTYSEISPGLSGIRFIARGTFGGYTGTDHAAGIEFYEAGRFLTITGNHIEGTPFAIEERDLTAIGRRYFTKKTTTEGEKAGPWHPVDIDALPISDFTRNVITSGDASAYGGDRSKALFGVAKDLLRAGLSNEDCARVLTDPANGISAKALEERHGDVASAMDWVMKYTVLPARREVLEEPPPVDFHPHQGGESAEGMQDPSQPPAPAALIASEAELAAARLAPRCIVENHSFSDVAQLVAPGGTGKTTLLIHEAIHIQLGWDLWGLSVRAPGWTLFVTAEDRREQILARLREILATLPLNPEERATAIAGVRVWDVAGHPLKLVSAADGNIVLTALADRIVEAYREDRPAVVIFDPLVSFGASEGMVNDNEQGLITAARRIVRGLDCCVRLVHHTGKGNAREGALDQYAGRGGSALADGTRMTSVLQTWTPDNPGGRQPPQGCHPAPEASITILSRAKLSYAPPNLPLIWIRRQGYAFEHFTEEPRPAPEVRRAAQADQVERFIAAELERKRYHTSHTLEAVSGTMNLSRIELRQALAELRVSGRIVDAPLPRDLCQGGRRTYLCPADNLAEHDGEVGPENATDPDPTSPPPTTSPPYRESTSGEVVPEGTFPDSCDFAANDWRGSAKSAKYTDSKVIPDGDDLVEVVI